MAIKKDHIELVELLLTHGADPYEVHSSSASRLPQLNWPSGCMRRNANAANDASFMARILKFPMPMPIYLNPSHTTIRDISGASFLDKMVLVEACFKACFSGDLAFLQQHIGVCIHPDQMAAQVHNNTDFISVIAAYCCSTRSFGDCAFFG